MGLFVAGWRRRKLRTKATLRRWEEEESREQALSRASSHEGQRVHIVLARSMPQQMPMPPPETEVPKVQHEGQWHTLH
jgi:ribosomal protein L21E